MFCISTCHVGLWMSQILFFTSMDCKREIIYFQYNICVLWYYFKHDVPSLKLMGDDKVIKDG